MKAKVTSPEEEEVRYGVELLCAQNSFQFIRWVDACGTLLSKDMSGNSLLHWAAALGDMKAISFLVDEGLDVNELNLIGSTPALCAAASCRNPGSVIDFLIRCGARMDVVNEYKETVYSLLEHRNLDALSSLFRLLQTTMEDRPSLFSSNGVGKDGVNFSQRRDLGSASTVIAGGNVSFKRDPALSSLSDGYLGGSYRTCKDAQEGHPLLLEMEEALQRVTITNDYWAQLFHLTFEGTAPLGWDDVTEEEEGEQLDMVARVLGERYSNGERWLLIQWKDEDGTPLPEGNEEWVAMNHVRHCEAVVAYLYSYDQTYSDLTMNTPSVQTPFNGLDTNERAELEKELFDIAQQKMKASPTAPPPSQAVWSEREPKQPAVAVEAAQTVTSTTTADSLTTTSVKAEEEPSQLKQTAHSSTFLPATHTGTPTPPTTQIADSQMRPFSSGRSKLKSPGRTAVEKPSHPSAARTVEFTPPSKPPSSHAQKSAASVRIDGRPPSSSSSVRLPPLKSASPDGWKGGSFNNTVSSTNSEMYIPSLKELAVKRYRPLGQDGTQGPSAMRTLFVEEKRGYQPHNLRPCFQHGHCIVSDRQKRQYAALKCTSGVS